MNLFGREAASPVHNLVRAVLDFRPSRISLLQYSLLAFPLAFAGLPIYLHAPDFYARHLQLSLVNLGALLLLLRLIDAVQDPLIGALSDRFHYLRHRILQLGIAMLCIGFWMLFHPWQSAPLLWFALSIFICTTGFSIVSINFNTLGGLWNVSQGQRTRVTGWREAFAMVGLLTASVLPPVLGSMDDPQRAFHILGLLFLLLMFPCAMVFFHWLRNVRSEIVVVSHRFSIYKSLLPILRKRWDRHFFGICFLSAVASAMPAILVIFFIRDYLEADAATGIFLLLYFLSGALGMPLWQRLAARIGKRRCWVIGMCQGALSLIWAFFLQPGDIFPYMFICIFSGLALGADLALPPAILADRLAISRTQASASSCFSLLIFLNKTALMLATGILLPLLGLLGYQPGLIVQQSTVFPLLLFYTLLPCTLKILAALWLWFMPEEKKLRSAHVRRQL